MNYTTHKSHRARLLGAVMALGMGVALSSGAKAEVLLSSQSGWDLSVDGSVNNFVVHQTYNHKELNIGGTTGGTTSTTRVRSGLLPAVLGINIKAPTVAGLDMIARFGFYPHTQNDNINKNQLGGQIDFREVFFKVDGKFGSVLVGKTLSLYLGKNILNDMTLLGVGAGTNGSGTTTLGRIGYGYVYPNFNSAVRYTTPTLHGLNVTLGVYDPSFVWKADDGMVDPNATPAGTNGATYHHVSIPRLEGEISFAKSFATKRGDVGLNTWANGMWQRSKAGAAEGGVEESDEINVWGVGGGVIVTWKGLSVEGSGYYGRGLGTILGFGDIIQDAVDANGNTRKNFGYIGEVTYDFGQGTGMGVSYGGSFGNGRAANDSFKDRNELLDAMLWHQINDNLRLVAEYGWQKDTDLTGEQQSHIFAAGGFFFF